MKLVALGENPVWDKESKKFVSSVVGEVDLGGTSTVTPKVEVEDPQITATTTTDDELPF